MNIPKTVSKENRYLARLFMGRSHRLCAGVSKDVLLATRPLLGNVTKGL